MILIKLYIYRLHYISDTRIIILLTVFFLFITIGGYLVSFFFIRFSAKKTTKREVSPVDFIVLFFANIYFIIVILQVSAGTLPCIHTDNNNNNDDNIILLLCGHNYGGVWAHACICSLPAHCPGLVYYLWQLSIFKMDISYQKSGASCLAFCGNSWPPTKKKKGIIIIIIIKKE